ncbi:COBRA-like protein 8 [Brassica rapa]|uniref:COBRA C-terminal domain-containing protein n=1 Tax=Brassica campestris TaxID=3711 RepID=M4DXG2_BRACM|nr:COBRA-like protein 8 [Brassica rapa]
MILMGLAPKLILLLSLFTTIQLTSSQPRQRSNDSTPPPPPTPPSPPPISPDAVLCNGIFVSYTYSTGTQIKPNDTKSQPYRFESVITVLNNGRDELKSWLVFVGFAHKEILVSASNAILEDGSSLPVSVENGTTFAGYPAADLKSAIMTAGDIKQMEARVELVGTQFGVAPPGIPLPNNITLVNDGWSCPKATKRDGNILEVCCMPDPKNETDPIGEKLKPRQKGDLTIMYDIIRPYATSYWAQVTIENHNPLGRLDNWDLSFEWTKDEFISQTKGAYPSVVDASACIDGPQGKHYDAVDFSTVLSCARKPHIIDLPLTKYNDSNLGLKPYCCRNGTILSPSMDPTKSKSVFQMEVYKMPPNLNISAIAPPLSWKIKGNFNPDYKCGPPARVSLSEFPDPSGLPSNRTAFASWQVACNITQPVTPSCCVSFSSYLNDSIIPCNTCACSDCSSKRVDKTCSTTSPALLLPPQALLIPFENRTKFAASWANLKHRKVPTLLPCGDYCGVSINWHLATDYHRGWSARITIFNWGGTNFADWSAAVELKNAAPDFEKAYSFNATTVAVDGKNTTVLMEGLPGLNYLVAEVDAKNPSKDYRVPGKQQSVISFTKKLNPGIKVGAGEGFPTKVFFNGQECSLPSIIPSNGHKGRVSTFLLMVLPVFALLSLWV